MIVNICANRFDNIYKQWARAYHYIIKTFLELGYEVHRSQYMDWDSTFEEYNLPIIEHDSDDFIYVHNHTWRRELEKQRFYTGKKLLIIKPTGPTTNHFTLDSEGYACSGSITYERPDFENVSSNLFFSTSIPEWKVERTNKWSEQGVVVFANSIPHVPEDHILILGQTPGDDTNSRMSFGNHWDKLVSIVSEIKNDNLLVIKLHPLQQENAIGETWETLYFPKIKEWQQEGITVFYSNESLYDVLPFTKLVILENSTAGIECMMHDVPIISYGYPEYHWVTKDLRHLNKLQEYIDDTSWFDINLSRSWVTWYCTRYQCYDYESTKKRILEILNDNYTT